jgi:hypothetical protein
MLSARTQSVRTCDGCAPYRLASSGTVPSSRSAAGASFALNVGSRLVRFFLTS